MRTSLKLYFFNKNHESLKNVMCTLLYMTMSAYLFNPIAQNKLKLEVSGKASFPTYSIIIFSECKDPSLNSCIK
jgi:hypothetical protein